MRCLDVHLACLRNLWECVYVCVCFGVLVFVLCSYNFMIFTGLVFSIDDLNDENDSAI